MRNGLFISALLLAPIVSLTSFAVEPVWTAHVLRRHSASLRLEGLELPQNEILVTLAARGADLRPYLDIHGRYARPGWKLYAPNAALLNANSDDIHIRAYLFGRTNEVTLRALGPNGERELETFYVYAPDVTPYHVGGFWSALDVALGLGSISYAQTGFGLYESVVGDLDFLYTSPPIHDRYGVSADLDLTVFTLRSSPIRGGPQILQGRVDGSLELNPNPEPRTHYQILLGLDYLTMFANGSPFGFKNLLAPEVGLRGNYTLDSLTDLVFQGRYVAIGRWHGTPQLGTEIGVAWNHRLKSGHRLKLGLDHSSYTYQPNSLTKISLDLTSIRLGYSL